MLNVIKRLVKEEEGQGMVEYALIIALIAIVVIVAIPGVSNAIKGIFGTIATKLGGTPTS